MVGRLVPARVTFLPPSEGGWSKPALPGIRPHLKLGEVQTTCVVWPRGSEASFDFGQPYDVILEVLFWDEYGHLFNPDEEIELFDGNRVIARGSWTIDD
jgi:hypothetical protein